MLIQRNDDRRLDEKGFASIVIALILIVVLALLTIGFAQLSRREQKNALDKQLANQAYYAAESGVNDVTKTIPAISAASPQPNKDTCLSDTQLTNFGLNKNIDSSRGVSYSCVLVNLQPPDILYDNVAPEADRYITFSTNPSPLSTLTVSWGSADNHTSFPGSVDGFKPLSQWGSRPGVIEFSITPLGTGAFDRNSLTNGVFTVYMYPSSTAGGVVYSTAKTAQGQIIPGNCHGSGTYTCSVTISGLPNTPGGYYLIHLVDHYDASNVDIGGKSGGTPVTFIDGQVQIDVTGKAQEVLKRIQVRVPVHPEAPLPEDAVQAGDICKRFTADPTTAAGFDSLSPVCKLDQ